MDDTGTPRTRKYRDDETPALGDVVSCFDGSFSSAIIVRVVDGALDSNLSPGPIYYLERPNASFSLGTLNISIERIGHVSAKVLREHYRVHVGPSDKVENRNY